MENRMKGKRKEVKLVRRRGGECDRKRSKEKEKK